MSIEILGSDTFKKLIDSLNNDCSVIYDALTKCFLARSMYTDSTGWNSLYSSNNEETKNELKSSFGVIHSDTYYSGSFTDIDTSNLGLSSNEAELVVANLIDFAKNKKSGLVYKSKLCVCTLTYDESLDQFTLTTGIAVPPNDPFIKNLAKLFPNINENGINRVVVNSLRYLIANKWKGFPSIYSDGLISTPVKKTGLFKLRDGNIIRIPKIGNNQRIFREATATGKILRNFIYDIDEKSKTIFYLDEKSQPAMLDYFGSIAVNDKYIINTLDKSISFLWDATGTTGLGAIYDWSRHIGGDLNNYKLEFKATNTNSLNEDVNNLINVTESTGGDKITSLSIGDVIYKQKDIFLNFIKDLRTAIEEKGTLESTENTLKPDVYLKFTGTLDVLEACANNDVVNLKATNLRERLEFNNTSADQAPQLPNLNTELAFFPHQATTIAKLNKSGKLAVIDVATGGGKTLCLICDILNLMNQKKIKRPLIVMPPSLIGQWISQIEYFTNGTINAYAITTETAGGKKLEKIAEEVRNAPPNTIFLTAYHYLTTGFTKTETGNVYTGANNILELVEPDYIATDESHFIKNIDTHFNKAITQLGDSVEYKRIATGTLINNSPEDLIGQLGFLDTDIVGNEAEFKKRYRTSGKKWKPNFADLVRRDLANNTNYIMYRKKDWAALLPEIKYDKHFVEMSDEMKKVYHQMVIDLMEEIINDPVLWDLWQKLLDGIIDVPPFLLGKLGKLEQFLTAPEMHPVLAEMGDKAISPKLPKIDELIGQSIAQGGKVIVAVHFKEAAKHLMKYSKYGNQSVYYDAANKNVVPEFQTNDNVKVMFAVVQSLKEGLNLQIANRIIIADIDWTPGNLDQLEARILRPSLTWENGQIVNKNIGKTVYIDTVGCNDSADAAKFMHQNWKKLTNAKIMENSPVLIYDKPKLSDDALVASLGDPIIGGRIGLDRIDEFNDWQLDQIKVERSKGNLNFVAPKPAPQIAGTKKMKTPWVIGMQLPLKEEEMSLSEFVTQFPEYNASGGDYRTVSDNIKGIVANTEDGYGVLVGANNNGKLKVWVRLFDGRKISVPGALIVVAPNMTEEQARKQYTPKKQKPTQPIGTNQQKPVVPTKPTPATPVQEPSGPTARPTEPEVSIPSGTVTKNGLNALASKFHSMELARKGSGDNARWVWRDNETRVCVDINGVSSLTDKSWKQWTVIIKNAVKKFEKYNEQSETPNVKPTQSKPSVSNKPITPTTQTEPELPTGDVTKNALNEYASNWNMKIIRNVDGDGNPIYKLKMLDQDLSVPVNGISALKDKSWKQWAIIIKNAAKKFEKLSEKTREPQNQEEKDNKLAMHMGTYNGIPMLLAYPDDPDSTSLVDYGFTLFPASWAFEVRSRQLGEALIEKLKKKYTIPAKNLKELQDVLVEMKKGIYPHEFPEENVRNWIKMNKIKAKKGELKIHPLIIDGYVYFVVDQKSHPGVNLGSYRFVDDAPFYGYIATTVSDLRQTLSKVKKNLEITNLQEVRDNAKELFKITI